MDEHDALAIAGAFAHAAACEPDPNERAANFTRTLLEFDSLDVDALRSVVRAYGEVTRVLADRVASFAPNSDATTELTSALDVAHLTIDILGPTTEPPLVCGESGDDEGPLDDEYVIEHPIEVDREELIRSLGGLLCRVHPDDAYDAFMTGMEMLLYVDEATAFDTMGYLRSHFADGDQIIERLTEFWKIEPDLIPRHFDCPGCGEDVVRLAEAAYMTLDDVWMAAGDPAGQWCLGCLEKALGRQLTREDFDWSIHMTYSDDYPRSDRLLNRMGRPEG